MKSLPKDTLFANQDWPKTGFRFDDQVAEVFSDMARRSIPFYPMVQDWIVQLFVQRQSNGKTVYDIGCSLGEQLFQLALHRQEDGPLLVGLDSAPEMITRARTNPAMPHYQDFLEFHVADCQTFDYASSSMIICSYTLQFIRPLQRASLLKRWRQALEGDGMLILSEKVIERAPQHTHFCQQLYFQFKTAQGYSELEISRKREALEHVLIPFTLEENIHLLNSCGFSKVCLLFKWANFATFLAEP
jgi:tRNA (cmo5U34)-methyltransferase